MNASGNVDIDSEIFITFCLVDFAGLWFESEACGVVAEFCNEARSIRVRYRSAISQRGS